jgi:hypothetical protein
VKQFCLDLLGHFRAEVARISDHQKSVSRQACCEHYHVYLTVLNPGAGLPILVIDPELLDPFPKRPSKDN